MNKYLQIQSYSDKKTSKPVLFGCTDPHLVQAGPGETNKNITKKLKEKERPPLVHFYNSSMGFVDEYDRQVTKYTLSLPVGRRPDKTAWTKKTCIFIIDMMLQNVYSFHRSKFQDNNPQATCLPKRFRQNFQINLAKAFLRKKITETNSVINFEDVPEPPRKRQKRVYCSDCPFDDRKRTQTVCAFCVKYICKFHSTQICCKCFEKKSFKSMN